MDLFNQENLAWKRVCLEFSFFSFKFLLPLLQGKDLNIFFQGLEKSNTLALRGKIRTNEPDLLKKIVSNIALKFS